MNNRTTFFTIVSVLGILVYFICSYLLLTYTKLPVYSSSLIAYACSLGFTYVNQKCWDFRPTVSHKVTLFRYAVLQICCATFVATFTQLSASNINISPLVLSTLATVFTIGIRYIVSSCWVFADSIDQSSVKEKSDKILSQLESPNISTKNHLRITLLTSLWLASCAFYIVLYYYMPWSINLSAGHDDMLFLNLAYSLTTGNWLGDYSQFTLMKGSGYAFFLALTHKLGLPLYYVTAVFHCISIGFFAWCLYQISHSPFVTVTLYSTLLIMPLMTSNGRIIRDQIYPDQFILSLTLLLYSLFIADTANKRWSTALLAGLSFAWLWLTREEGIWVVPTVMLLLLFGLINHWRKKPQQRHLISSVLVMVLSFSSILMTFQLVNWRIYDRFIGLDIKEKNFKAALSSIQSVREGDVISHVPVSQMAMQQIYKVSPHFSKLEPYFTSIDSRKWLNVGCQNYPWTCDKEFSGGWFLWVLRDAVASAGYYQSPEKAANFYSNVANEVNKACNDGRLSCNKSLFSYLPAITQHDINEIPDTIILLLNTLLLSEISPQLIRSHSNISGGENISSRIAVLEFLNSSERFRIGETSITIKGILAVDHIRSKKFELSILDSTGKNILHTYKLDSSELYGNEHYHFHLVSTCQETCYLVLTIDEDEVFRKQLSTIRELAEQQKPIELGPVQLTFDEITWDGHLSAVFGAGESVTYQVRSALFTTLQRTLPMLISFGLIAFITATVLSIKRRYFSLLYVLDCALWLAILARLSILFLIHISSFPALNPLYFMPLYSLIIITSVISLYLFFDSLSKYLQKHYGHLY